MDPKKRFDFGASVGRDELGEVHRAESSLGGPPLAVKCFDAWAVERIEASGRLAEQMEGLAGAGARRTPPVVDWWLGGGEGWLATGWVEGRSLAARLEEDGPMEVEAALSLAAGILDALDELHGIGGAHGGLTPRKVITVGGEDGSSVVLTDPYQFELYAVTDPIRTSRSEPERYVGLPQYFSPEQAQGQRPDIRSDLYVVGLIIYEMIAGKPPFQSNAVHTTLRRQIYEKPLPLRLARPGLEVDSGLEDLLQSVLAKEVGNRFDSAAAFRRALEAVGAVSGADAPSEPLGDLPARAAELRERLLDAGAAESGAAPPDVGPAKPESRAGDTADGEDSGTAAEPPESADGDADTGTDSSDSDVAPSEGSSDESDGEMAADDHSDAADTSDEEPSSRSGRKRSRKSKRKKKGARQDQDEAGGSGASATDAASADAEPPPESAAPSSSSTESEDEESGGSMTSGAWFAVGDDDEKLREHHTQRIVLETPVPDSGRLNRRFFAVMFVVLVVVVGGILYLTNRPGDEADEPARAEALSPVTPAPSTPSDPPAPEATEEAPAAAAVPSAVEEASRAVADASAEPVDGDADDSDPDDEGPRDGDPFDEAGSGAEEADPAEADRVEEASPAEEPSTSPAAAERRERTAEPVQAEATRPEEPAEQPAPVPRIEVAEAEEPTEPEVDSSRDDARRLVRDGQRSLDARDLGAARRAFEGAIEADERNAAAHAGLGDVFFAERNYSEAARHHRRATRLAPRNAEYHRKLGQDFFRLNMFDRALESFERAVELGDEGSQRFADIARDRAGSGD